jgi:hypothetical protein
MTRPERLALVDHDDPAWSVTAQCRLLKVARSTLYTRTPGEPVVSVRWWNGIAKPARVPSLDGGEINRLAWSGGLGVKFTDEVEFVGDQT